MVDKFNIIFASLMNNLVTEGGHAFEGLSSINRENISGTIEFFNQNVFIPLGITGTHWTAELGSVGKKAKSGDIDIAVNMQELTGLLNVETIAEIKQKITEQLTKCGFEFRQVGANIMVKVPIQSEDQVGEFVQIDLFLSEDLEFAKQRFYSPSETQSKYKGAHRRMAVSAFVKALTLAIADDQIEGEVFISPDGTEYPGLTFSFISLANDGFYRITKTFKGAKGKILKNSKHVEPKTKELITRDWQELLDILFGEGKYTVADLESFETIWNNILMSEDFPYKDKLKNIVIILYNLIKDDTTIVMPEEVTNFLGL
jgi:hypothetical protein